MQSNINIHLREWLGATFPGSHLQRVRRLEGGSATVMSAFDFVDSDGDSHTCILRQPNAHDLARDPRAAEHEYALLAYLEQQGLSVPSPVGVDQLCRFFPTPTLILRYLAGAVVYEPINRSNFAQQAAFYLAKLHQLTPDRQILSFLPQVNGLFRKHLDTPPEKLDNALLEGRVRKLLSDIWPMVQTTSTRLLHGDYWLGNMLWQGDSLTAVIDWENAMLGDPLADLAIARLEMLLMFDEPMMRNFTETYLQTNPLKMETLPWWELTTVLRSGFHIEDWAAPKDVKGLREKQRWYFTQAFDQLGITY